MKDLSVAAGNPVLTSRDQRGEFYLIIACADVNANIAYCRVDVDRLILSNGDGFIKKYKYPEDVTLSWVLQKITAFSVTNLKHKDLACHARAREVFLGPFMHVLNHKDGVLEIKNDEVYGWIPDITARVSDTEIPPTKPFFEVRMATKHIPPDVMEELIERCKTKGV